MGINLSKWAKSKASNKNKADPVEHNDLPRVTETEPKSGGTQVSSGRDTAAHATATTAEDLARIPTFARASDDLREVIAMVQDKASACPKAVAPLVVDACTVLRGDIVFQDQATDAYLAALGTDSHYRPDQLKARAETAISGMSMGLVGNPRAVDNALANAVRADLQTGIQLYQDRMFGDPEFQAQAAAKAQGSIDTLEALRIAVARARTDALLPDGLTTRRNDSAQELLASERVRYQCSLKQPAELLLVYRDAVDRQDEQRQLDLEYGCEGHVRGLISGGLDALKKASRRPNDLDRAGEAKKVLDDCYALMNAIEQQRALRFPVSILLAERIFDCLLGIYRVVVGIDPRTSSRASIARAYLQVEDGGRTVDNYAVDPGWGLRVNSAYQPLGPADAGGRRRRMAPSSDSPWMVTVTDLIKSQK